MYFICVDFLLVFSLFLEVRWHVCEVLLTLVRKVTRIKNNLMEHRMMKMIEHVVGVGGVHVNVKLR